MICTANRNGASSAAYRIARLIITTASSRAACTALRTNRMPSAARTMIGARIQKMTTSGLALVGSPGARRERPRVVVALVVAELHRVRRLLHAGQQRREQVGLLVDEVRAVVVRQLVLVGHRERPGRARLDAQAAQDAAQVVDLVDGGVALARREPAGVGVVSALDVDGVGRAGPRAQLAADALLEPVRVPVQD